MAKKLYEETDIQAIASAIRGKNGTTETYKTSEMADAITNLPTSGGGGGESKGVIINRANPLPMCLPYHHQAGSSSYSQYHYLTFIWPAGVEQVYLNHDYALTTFSTDSYKMSTVELKFGGNLQLVAPSGSLTTPLWLIAPTGTHDFTANTNTPLADIVTNGGKIWNANGTAKWETFKFTIKASSYLGGTPTEDTPCVIRVTTRGYGSSAAMIGILTVQEEAFEE